MKFATALLVVLATFSSLVSAQSGAELEAITRAASLYPTCAFDCMKQMVPQSKCALTDVQCLCTNTELTAEIEGCVLHHCTIVEGLQAKNITMNMCGAPVRDKHIQPLVIAITGGTLATLCFVMRICATLSRRSGRSLGVDDLMAGAAVLFAGPPTLLAIPFRDNGLGKDIWTLELGQIKNVLMFYYLGSIFYIASITMVKMSLIFFMLRVFPGERFRYTCYGVMALIAGYGISFVTATALQCWPANYAWQQVDDSHDGKCNNVHLQAWMAAAFNIVLDLALLILPLPSLWALNMGLKKKMMIMVMFSLGIFVTVISIIRLHTLIKFAASTNISWDYVEAGYWSLVEMHASIICACLPYCRHFLINFGANFLKSTRPGESRDYASKTTGKRGGSDGNILSMKGGEGQQTPKHGDESDFVPLVEYPYHKRDKQTAASEATTGRSADSM